ncbi:hypothetical protein TNCT_149751 [Trichonephila clavata]|uniref:Uncharacterized protein n=1 Tax=Trichonephila clavata TaxID=2740835 RepID=A0A8X6HK59_TRICU|nr:hypothetical protein TNCT_149751 [Trichonephila clavata]
MLCLIALNRRRHRPLSTSLTSHSSSLLNFSRWREPKSQVVSFPSLVSAEKQSGYFFRKPNLKLLIFRLLSPWAPNLLPPGASNYLNPPLLRELIRQLSQNFRSSLKRILGRISGLKK